MRGPDRPPCSHLSTQLDEPLEGTASRYRLWLMVEQPGPWGHHPLVQSGLPVELGRRLRDLGHDLGIRVLLVKRRDPPTAARRCFVAYTGTRERRLAELELDDPAELLDIDLPTLAWARFAGVGKPLDRPLHLVCTHGKHDPCCARRGGPLFRALAHRPEVWECTHIGGDRFAANLVSFPHGLYFGRVPAGVGERIVGAYSDGHIDLSHYRGRSAFSPPVQAAEHHVRTAHGITGVDELQLVAHRGVGEDRHRVTFRDAGHTYEVDVEVREASPRRLTCKAVDENAPRAFALRAG